MFVGGTKFEHPDLFEGRKFVQYFFSLAHAQLTQQPTATLRHSLFLCFLCPYVLTCVCTFGCEFVNVCCFYVFFVSVHVFVSVRGCVRACLCVLPCV